MLQKILIILGVLQSLLIVIKPIGISFPLFWFISNSYKRLELFGLPLAVESYELGVVCQLVCQ